MAFTVIAPTTGEKLIKGQPYTIKWSTTSTSKPTSDTVKLYIRLKSDLNATVESINTVAPVPSLQGSFVWTPQTLYTSASVWVREISANEVTNPEYTAKSGYFNIVEGTVLKPREFRCVLTNTAGETISNVAKLTVNP